MFIQSIANISATGVHFAKFFLDGIEISWREYIEVQLAAADRNANASNEEGC